MNSPDGMLWDLAQTDATRLAMAQQDAKQTDAGLNALATMMQQPEVRDAVVAFRTDLEAASHQIDLLASLKELHDHLHNVEFQCFRVIQQQTARFPDDDLAVDILFDNQQTLHNLCQQVQEVAQRPVLGQQRLDWVADLVTSDALLHEAVTDLVGDPLRNCVRRLRRLLTREPSRINDQLNHTAAALRLDTIVTALSGVAEHLETEQAEATVDRDRLAQLEQGVDALERLHATLAQAVADHATWQRLDLDLRRIDAVLAHDLEELFFSWPDVQTLAQTLRQDVADRWAQDLLRHEEALDKAVRAEDPAQIRRHFYRFRRRTGLRFYDVDSQLKDLCGELTTIAGPVDSVLRMLG
jgi:hypothetical protein